MNYAIGIPKSIHVILKEGRIDTKGMNGDQMHKILGSHEYFKNEKSFIESLISMRITLFVQVLLIKCDSIVHS